VNGFVNGNGQELAFGDHCFNLETETKINWQRSQNMKQMQWMADDNYLSLNSSELVYMDLSDKNNLAQLPIDNTLWYKSVLGYIFNHEGIKNFIFDAKKQTLSVASNAGLFQYSKGIKKELKDADGNSIYATDLRLDKQGALWVASISNGILCFKGDGIIHQFAKEYRFTQLAIDEKTVWGISTQGLIKIEISTGKTELFNQLDGLPTNNISNILIQDNAVWLATMKGLVRLPKTLTCRNAVAPKLEIWSVAVNQNSTTEFADLSHYENNISFELFAHQF